MIANDKSLLLAFNDAEASLPAVDYGIWLASQTGVPVTLLGIIEKPSARERVDEISQAAIARLEATGIPYQKQLISGNCRKVIWQQAKAERHLTIFGPFDRPVFRRWLRGRSFRRIFEKIDTPVLYVKRDRLQLRNILVCMGGLGYAKSAANWALFLAQRLDASITLFHVVEPISYDYPTTQKILPNWEDILKTNTPQAKNLGEALTRAQDMGVVTSFKARRGDIVHEITTEVHAQDYDLVVMGSSNSSDSLRNLSMPNITAEIAETVICPVLAAGLGQELIFTGSR